MRGGCAHPEGVLGNRLVVQRTLKHHGPVAAAPPKRSRALAHPKEEWDVRHDHKILRGEIAPLE